MAQGVPAGRAVRKTPFLLPLDSQCTLSEPSASVVRWEPPAGEPVISHAYAAGFPPSDTAWCGPAVVAHAQTQAAADAAADAYLAFVLAQEPRFGTRLWPAAQGVQEGLRLARSARRPIILADTQDNPGAGGSGDTTGVLQALLAAGAQDAMVGYFCDPEAARAAHAAGPGQSVDLALGGRHGPEGVQPVRERFEVLRCASGPFRMTGSVAGNVDADLGAMALLRCRGVQVAVTSRKVQAYDPAPFQRLGVDPAAHRILVLKSSCHFRADFEPLADAVLSVLAPGAYDPDAARYPYTRLRPGVRFAPGA
jgi:microcystin degradation protein MlrC